MLQPSSGFTFFIIKVHLLLLHLLHLLLLFYHLLLFLLLLLLLANSRANTSTLIFLSILVGSF